MTHDEMIAVIQAHKDGKTIQWKGKHSTSGRFSDVEGNDPSWNFNATNYRVKPEPFTRWAAVGFLGNKEISYVYFGSKQEAEDYIRTTVNKVRLVKLVEEL